MGRDEIDAQRAKQYAWSLELPDESMEEPDGEEPGSTEKSSVEAEKEQVAWRAEIRTKANTLAAAVERVWNGTMSDEQQARQVEALIEFAAELNLGMVAMPSESPAPVRLARLVHRHWHRLSEEVRENARASFMWADFEPAAAVELLVELCRDGNEDLAGMLFLPLFHGPHRDELRLAFLDTGLGEQLIALLEAADSLRLPWTSRLIALEWLRLAPCRSAIPVLRRLLRLPHLEVRWHALALLLNDYKPPALRSEDVLFMLEDLLIHPPEDGRASDRYEASSRYLAFLHEAVTTLRPEGGAEILEQLAFEGDCLRFGYRGDWEGKWALIALSAAYPERALCYIDRCMRNSSWYTRLTAVEAAAELPEEQAHPRLVALAADGAASVAERARDRFIKRFSAVCPVEPLAGFPVELLADPPSERLYGRLLCLRGPLQETRVALVEVLLAEAPCPEALALITFALCDDHLLDASTRGRLPKDRKGMYLRLYRRFGAPAIAALCWLIERYPERGLCDRLGEVSELVTARKLRKRDLEPLRSLAARWLEAPDPNKQQHALQVLAKVGAPVGLKDRLVELAWLDEPSPYWVGEVLRAWPADKALDVRICKEAQEAWANRELSKLSRALRLGFSRRIRSLDRLAREILATWQEYAAVQRAKGGQLCRPDAELPLSLAVQCIRHLHAKKQVDASTIQAWLATPAAPEFLLATHLPLEQDDATLHQVLLAALNAPTSPREAAQEAAAILLHLKILDPDDARLRELFENDFSLLRFWVMHHIAFGKCKKREAHQLAVAALLKTATVADEQDLGDSLPRLAQAVGVEAVKLALAELPHQDLRQRLLAILCEEDADSDYWQDATEAPR